MESKHIPLLIGIIGFFALLWYGYQYFDNALLGDQTQSVVSTSSTPIQKTTTNTVTNTNTRNSSSSISDTNWQQQMKTVGQADQNTTVPLNLHERFVIQLGSNMKWTLIFDPADGITRVQNTTTANGIQGVYEADQKGVIVLHAIGAPICNPGEMCPQYMINVTINFAVS